MPRWSANDGLPSDADVIAAVEQYPHKFYWFISKGYVPHIYQSLFHGMTTNETLSRFRHLVAGRRGGKTLSAAWETLYYCLHPEHHYADFYGREWAGQPLWIWALAKDYKVGRASYLTMLAVIRQAGLVSGTDYKLNKGDKFIEFYRDGEPIALLEFKTADDPQSLRGAGLDLLWIDEAAFVRTDEAWTVVYPALSDKQGGVITTTTPAGRNWFYDFAFGPAALEDANHSSVMYRSVDNTHFKAEEWQYARTHMHPMLFSQEYMASFDAFQGVELMGEWLHYYVIGQASAQGDDIILPKSKDGKLPLRTFIGVDPAISLADKADRFAMALIGVDDATGLAYLLDLYAGKIPFPEQIKMIQTWHLKYRPYVIGIESNAYQAALSQMASQLPGMPPIQEVTAKGKKAQRILRMAPLFQLGRVRIHRTQMDFIAEWVGFDSTLTNGKDDTLDAVQIALRCAGALLPEEPQAAHWSLENRPAGSVDELATRALRELKGGVRHYDEEMGDDW